MADNVTNDLLLEHLKSIQAKMTKIDERLDNIEARIRIIEDRLASFMQYERLHDNNIAALQARLDRIEKRLELTDG